MVRTAVRVVGAAIAVVVVLVAVPAAQAVSGTVTMYSNGDFIGEGVQRIYDTAQGDAISGAADDPQPLFGRRGLSVEVDGGPLDGGYELDFAAPEGRPFGPGVYVGAEGRPFLTDEQPGISVWGHGHGCNIALGGFEVRDWALDASGALQRAWVVFEQYCDSATGVMFGEVRLGEPAATAAPGLVRWPATDAGRRSLDVPVEVAGGRIASAAVVGAPAGDFWVADDRCSGAGPGPCPVWVAFRPTASGVREARLRLTDTAGARTEVPLQGFAYGGVTALDMVSDDEPIGQGKTWHYGPDAKVLATESPTWLQLSVYGVDGTWWFLDFGPVAGQALAPGTYTGVSDFTGVQGPNPTMNVRGNGRGCSIVDGGFTINELTFDPALLTNPIVDGNTPRTVSVSFEQRCQNSPGALRGTLKFRAGDTTPLAPWMIADMPAAPPDAAPPAGPPPSSAQPPGPGPASVAPVAVPADRVARPDSDEHVRAVLARERRRHAHAVKAFTAATRNLRRDRLPQIRAATARLARELAHYRRAVTATRPADAPMTATRRRLLRALARGHTRLRSFQRAARSGRLATLAHERPGVLRALKAIT
jgi:hypothetical protein